MLLQQGEYFLTFIQIGGFFIYVFFISLENQACQGFFEDPFCVNEHPKGKIQDRRTTLSCLVSFPRKTIHLNKMEVFWRFSDLLDSLVLQMFHEDTTQDALTLPGAATTTYGDTGGHTQKGTGEQHMWSLWDKIRSDSSATDPEKGPGLSAEQTSFGDYSRDTYELLQTEQKQTED